MVLMVVEAKSNVKMKLRSESDADECGGKGLVLMW
jgi:hypothetical protein